jgi:hypothetical protein
VNKLVVGSPARRGRLDPIHFPVEEFAPHRRARLEEGIGRVLDEVDRQIEELRTSEHDLFSDALCPGGRNQGAGDPRVAAG